MILPEELKKAEVCVNSRELRDLPELHHLAIKLIPSSVVASFLEKARKELKEEIASTVTIVGISKLDILEQLAEKVDAVFGGEGK